MRPVATSGLSAMIVDAEFRARVDLLVDRLGQVRLVAAESWRPFVDRLRLGDRIVAETKAPALVVGSPAAVLRHAEHEQNDFGFIMPVAQLARPWQRARHWRDDTTLDLWQAGWSLLAIDRLLVAGEEATVEFVIGSARRTPTTATS